MMSKKKKVNGSCFYNYFKGPLSYYFVNISILKKLIENKIQWLLFQKKFKTLKFHHSDHFFKIFTSSQLFIFIEKRE